MVFFLKSNRIGLEKVGIEHVTPKYLSWLNDSEVTKYLESGFFPSSLNDLTQYITQRNSSNEVFLAIIDLASNEHIGNIKLSNINWIHRTAEIGIMIGEKNYWGKGYGTEAVKLVVEYGFNVLNLRKIYLGVYGNHQAAIKSYERAGFEVDGILKEHLYLDGTYVDKVYMSIFNKKSKDI
jgi:[ribosomal protein S5]-alanine N-acetyltransferase